jgi:hypothetical protein
LVEAHRIEPKPPIALLRILNGSEGWTPDHPLQRIQ